MFRMFLKVGLVLSTRTFLLREKTQSSGIHGDELMKLFAKITQLRRSSRYWNRETVLGVPRIPFTAHITGAVLY